MAEIPCLKRIYETFGKNKRFVIASVSLDADGAHAAEFAREHGMAWTQCWVVDDAAASKYGVVGIPAIFLIAPDGRVLATDLRGEQIEAVVKDALSK